jgi:cytochrome c oxidase subunit 2
MDKCGRLIAIEDENPMIGLTPKLSVPLQQIIPKGTRVEVFDSIYEVFLGLGTVVGVIVISYMLYNAYKYRDSASRGPDEDGERPELGELPQGGGKGRKLFLSFALSAIVVSSLIVWTYGTLLYVENRPANELSDANAQEPLEIRVTGYQFGWTFHYPNNASLNLPISEDSAGDVKIPQGRTIQLKVTSSDVWHNFGVPEWRVKTDAIPGQMTETWFEADETGPTRAICYELCGAGHSNMRAWFEVVPQDEFQSWYDDLNGSETSDWPPWEQDEGGESEGGSESESLAGSGVVAPRVGGPA